MPRLQAEVTWVLPMGVGEGTSIPKGEIHKQRFRFILISSETIWKKQDETESLFVLVAEGLFPLRLLHGLELSVCLVKS